jgi:predicted ATPase/DNA-binding SARP family transcriptional activator
VLVLPGAYQQAWILYLDTAAGSIVWGCSMPQPIHALPVPLSPLVGRETELGDIASSLRSGRLLTLTGPGGSGKTRLALATATHATKSQPASWVDLTRVTDNQGVGQAVAAALAVPETPGQAPASAIPAHIRDEHRLLILDNCEHVTEAAATLAEGLLAACPHLVVLATSREPLSIDGERTWPVPPLREADALGLFQLRAQMVHPSFRVTAENEDKVRHICQRLDSLPLAIELAAARLRVLSAAQLASRLDNLFTVLVGGSRSAPARHQTLRAALDWSHDMLDPDEQMVFRRLGVFAGGFTLEAAEQVCAATGVLDVLTRLADKSLVRVEHNEAEYRYRLLATIREYALSKLAGTADEATARTAHLRYYQRFASELNEAARLNPALFDAELANLRAAVEYAHACGDPVAALELASSLDSYAALRGYYEEVRQWLHTALASCPDAPPALRAKALLGGGRLALLQCDYGPAANLLEQALELYRELGDGTGVAGTLRVLGSVAREQGRYDAAVELYAESLTLTTDNARVQNSLAFVAWLRCDFEQAERNAQAALEQHRARGDVAGMASSLIHLGVVARFLGQSESAVRLLEQARSLAEEIGAREAIAWSLQQLGLLNEDTGQLLLSLKEHTELRDRWRMSSLLDDLAGVALREGNAARAARLLGGAEAIRDAIGTVIAPAEQPGHDATVAGAQAALGAEAFDAAHRQGLVATAADLRADLPKAGARVADSTAFQALLVPPQPGPEPLRITALGGCTVALGDSALSAAQWGYAKPRELMFLLATSGPMGKEQIGAALWPELAGRQLSNALHTALRELRRALGDPGWVRYADSTYRFDRSRPHSCDVTDFEDALLAARRAKSSPLPDLYRAIAAYGGDFLDGFAAREWALARRDELRGAFETALLTIGRLEAAAGRHRAANTVFQRAVVHDPLNESAHRELMTSLVNLGETARAVRHYERLVADLRQQLGVGPAPQTTAIYHRITAMTDRSATGRGRPAGG